MYSFYGGRPGESFVIAGAYENKTAMEADSSNIQYGEYAIIETTNKNDLTNGDLYRKDYSGFKKVGNISGPAGPAPSLEFKSIKEISSTETPITYNITNENLIPGASKKNDTWEFNDAIIQKNKYTVDADGKATTAQIGLQIPYPVFDFSTTALEPNAEPTITKLDSQHPFYQQWKFGIPRGKVGLTRLAFESKNDGTGDYQLVYYTDDGETPTSLGVYNRLTNLQLETDGTLSAIMNDGQTTRELGKIRWIDNITTENGKLVITYNTQLTNGNAETKSLDFTWISDLYYDENTGVFDILRSNGGRVSICEIKQIIDANLANDGTLTFIRNGEEPSPGEENTRDIVCNTKLKFIDHIEQNNDGSVTVVYNTLNQNSQHQTSDPFPIGISNITFNDGQITINYGNNKTTTFDLPLVDDIAYDKDTNKLIITLGDRTIALDTPLLPDDVTINNEQKLQFTWGDNQYVVGDPINYVTDTKIDTNGNLLMSFSDPQFISDEDEDKIQEDGKVWKNLGKVKQDEIPQSYFQNINFQDIGVVARLQQKYLSFFVNFDNYLNNFSNYSITGGKILIRLASPIQETEVVLNEDEEEEEITSLKNYLTITIDNPISTTIIKQQRGFKIGLNIDNENLDIDDIVNVYIQTMTLSASS